MIQRLKTTESFEKKLNSTTYRSFFLPHTGQRSLFLSVCAAAWSHCSATVWDRQVLELPPRYSAAWLGSTFRPLQRPTAAQSSQRRTADCPAVRQTA